MKTTQFVFGMCLLFAAVPPVSAQSATGFMIGGHLNASAWELDDFEDDREEGVGAGLVVGYGFTRVVAIYFGLDAASMSQDIGDNYALAHADLGVLLHLLGGRPVQPYFDIALNGRAAEWTSPIDASTSGGGLSVGVGLKWFFNPNVALNLLLKRTGVELTEFEVNGVELPTNVDATSGRFSVGIVYHAGG